MTQAWDEDTVYFEVECWFCLLSVNIEVLGFPLVEWLDSATLWNLFFFLATFLYILSDPSKNGVWSSIWSSSLHRPVMKTLINSKFSAGSLTYISSLKYSYFHLWKNCFRWYYSIWIFALAMYPQCGACFWYFWSFKKWTVVSKLSSSWHKPQMKELSNMKLSSGSLT